MFDRNVLLKIFATRQINFDLIWRMMAWNQFNIQTVINRIVNSLLSMDNSQPHVRVIRTDFTQKQM